MQSFSSASHIAELIDSLPQSDDVRARGGGTAGPVDKTARIAWTTESWRSGWPRGSRPTGLKSKMANVLSLPESRRGETGRQPVPQEVTQQMVWNFEAGGAAINQLCETADLDLSVTALDLNRPTIDFTTALAMDPDEVLHAMNAGAAAVGENCDYLIVGEMGIGNTTSAAALSMGRFGGDAGGWVGPGTGLDPSGVTHKAMIVQAAIDRHGVPSTAVSAFSPPMVDGNSRPLPALFSKHGCAGSRSCWTASSVRRQRRH